MISKIKNRDKTIKVITFKERNFWYYREFGYKMINDFFQLINSFINSFRFELSNIQIC